MISLFQGLFMSTVHCLTCKKESITFETFSNLTLPLPANRRHCSLKVYYQQLLVNHLISQWVLYHWNQSECKKNNAYHPKDLQTDRQTDKSKT